MYQFIKAAYELSYKTPPEILSSVTLTNFAHKYILGFVAADDMIQC